MVKTSTTKNIVNYNNTSLTENVTKEVESFYDGIKSKLDKLLKEPSEASINKILAYAKKK